MIRIRRPDRRARWVSGSSPGRVLPANLHPGGPKEAFDGNRSRSDALADERQPRISGEDFDAVLNQTGAPDESGSEQQRPADPHRDR
jgi:hypothetical protein